MYDYSVAVDGGIYKGACLYPFVVKEVSDIIGGMVVGGTKI